MAHGVLRNALAVNAAQSIAFIQLIRVRRGLGSVGNGDDECVYDSRWLLLESQLPLHRLDRQLRNLLLGLLGDPVITRVRGVASGFFGTLREGEGTK